MLIPVALMRRANQKIDLNHVIFNILSPESGKVTGISQKKMFYRYRRLENHERRIVRNAPATAFLRQALNGE